MKLLWLIHVLALKINVQSVMCNDVSVKYVNTWETVILSCQLQTSVFSKRWRRGNDPLFQGINVNSNTTNNSKYAIVGNETDGEYNLQIANTTKEDNGTYFCDLQLPKNIISRKYVLIVKETSISSDYEQSTLVDNKQFSESESVDVQTGSWTKERFVTETSINSDYGQSTLVDNKQSTVSEKEISTEINRDHTGKEGDKETGLSSRDTFYYGLFAAGFVLVLLLSTLCNACVNRKCGTTIPKTTATITIETKTDTPDDNNANIEITDSSDITSLYETINENEMLPDSSVAGKCNKLSDESTPIALPEKPYFEIVDSYFDVIPVKDLDQSKKHLQTKAESSKTKDISLHLVKRRNSSPESKTSSEDTVDVMERGDDGYLHPYVALKTDEMEYLHSYSTPCLVPVEIRADLELKSSAQEADNYYYTDSFSAKDTITKV